MKASKSTVTAAIVWLLSVFFSILSGLLFLIFKREDAFIHQQAKEALNWGITLWLAVIAASLFGSKLLFTLLGVIHLVFCLLGMASCLKGKAYQVPINLRLIK
ncbi:DUF4870 domain-containing protein [Vibrio rumoiensis]|uniref:DUF4870 domain-containing protein n=1 Tax=Vibrio rumoiensis TaxID=76258 RepID=A0ABW7IZ12_9VIBR